MNTVVQFDDKCQTLTTVDNNRHCTQVNGRHHNQISLLIYEIFSFDHANENSVTCDHLFIREAIYMTTKKALVVAINDYGGPPNDLPSCVKDANAFV